MSSSRAHVKDNDDDVKAFRGREQQRKFSRHCSQSVRGKKEAVAEENGKCFHYFSFLLSFSDFHFFLENASERRSTSSQSEIANREAYTTPEEKII